MTTETKSRKGIGGRPTKYDPKYCDMIVEHMKQGASMTSFAAEIDVARSTITEWADNYPEFSASVKRAKAKCAAWWELQARMGATGEMQVNPTLVIFGLKNMAAEDWRDKQEVSHSGRLTIEKSVSDMTDEELMAIINEHEGRGC